MLPSVAGALLSVVVLAYVMSGSAEARHKRHILGAMRLRRGVVTAYCVLLVLNAWCVVLAPRELVCDAVVVTTLLVTAGVGYLTTERRLPAVTMVQKRKVLAVGAHPDDLELACGATLAKLVDGGHEVRGLIMSQGEQGGDRNMRPCEAERGAAFLGLTELRTHNFPDTALETASTSMVAAIETMMMDFGPDIILTHSAHDQHQDHYAVHLATLRAARTHHSILCYESPSVTREFEPSVFVDIDGYVDVKVEAVLCHRDQSGKPYMSARRVRSMAAFRGAQAKNNNSEAFESVRLLGSAIGDL